MISESLLDPIVEWLERRRLQVIDRQLRAERIPVESEKGVLGTVHRSFARGFVWQLTIRTEFNQEDGRRFVLFVPNLQVTPRPEYRPDRVPGRSRRGRRFVAPADIGVIVERDQPAQGLRIVLIDQINLRQILGGISQSHFLLMTITFRHFETDFFDRHGDIARSDLASDDSAKRLPQSLRFRRSGAILGSSVKLRKGVLARATWSRRL